MGSVPPQEGAHSPRGIFHSLRQVLVVYKGLGGQDEQCSSHHSVPKQKQHNNNNQQIGRGNFLVLDWWVSFGIGNLFVGNYYKLVGVTGVTTINWW